jgi:hypothetical protein
MHASLDALTKLVKLFGTAPKHLKSVADWYGLKPSDGDRRVIREYCKHLNERRVFFAPYHREAAGACRYSLEEVRRLTYEASAKVEHPGATAFLHSILDHVRKFLDAWSGPEPQDEALVRFCMDLGTLRTSVRAYVALLQTLEPKAKAPNLFRDEPPPE